MHDLRFIINNAERVKADATAKKDDCDIDRIIELAARRKEIIPLKERLRSEQKKLGRQIGPMRGRGEDSSEIESRLAEMKREYKQLEKKEKETEKEIRTLLERVPNIIHESVPDGDGPEDNPVRDERGGEVRFPENPRPHWEIGENLGILDLEAGASVSGSGFYFLRGDGAIIERALISWFLDEHRAAGYTELSVPFLVTERSLWNSGQLPKFIDQMYKIPEDDLFCIPTAEVPLTSYLSGKILESEQLPLRYAAYSSCFRREAGAAGKDTRGILRVHQFSKVELYHFERPERSYEVLEELTGQAISLLDKLGLKWRKIELCRGDLGFGAAKCYDLEVYSPGVDRWLEVSSCSNCQEFQARRAEIRYRGEDGKPHYVHSLNGSGLATPRVIIAILETFLQPDGSVLIPEVLRPYFDGRERIKAGND